MRPSASVLKPLYRDNEYGVKRALPHMSWKPENLFNIWQRTANESPAKQDINFTRSSRTVFQQRWVAKRLLKGYHADFMGTRKFERWFLPANLPVIHARKQQVDDSAKWVEGRYSAGGRTREERFQQKKEGVGRSPIGSLMYQEVERRLDVAVFRACFAESIYMARHFVISGRVKLNGQTIRNTNTLLNPGDIFSVDPKIIPFLRPPPESERLSPQLEAAIDGNENDAVEAEETAESSEAKAASEDASARAESTESTDSSAAAESSSEASSSEAAEATKSDKTSKSSPSTSSTDTKGPIPKSHFTLPPYASPSIFVPAYLLPSFLTCSCVYVRHPTARPGYSEIPTPFDAGGELMSLGWEWYRKKAPRMRSKVDRWWNPQRTKDGVQIPRSE